MICALPAFWIGILYDDENLDSLWKETSTWQENDILNLYQDVPSEGLNSNFMNLPLHEHGKKLLSLSKKGLEKRGYLNSDGRDESIHLEKLNSIIEQQKNPADLLIEEFKDKKNILSLLNNTYY
jgi:glutamate--cysteine ligase